jgi:hypothetical protein
MALPSLVVYIKRNSLVLTGEGIKTGIAVEVPEELYNNLEISNGEKFADLLKLFLIKNKIKPGNAMIILSEEVLFYKLISETNKQLLLGEVKKFLDSIPLDPTRVSTKMVAGKGKMLAMAANKQIYETVSSGLKMAEFEVMGVVPEIAFANFSLPNWKKMLSQGNILKRSDFLIDTGIPTRVSGPSGWVVVIIILLVGGLVTGGWWVWKNKKAQLVEKVPLVAKFEPTATPTLIPTPTMEAVNKKDLLIQVINGSGTVGEAGRIERAFNSAGYLVADKGNATESGSGKGVLVEFSGRVEKVWREEVADKLGGLFTAVYVQEMLPGNKYDMVVTTGIAR